MSGDDDKSAQPQAQDPLQRRLALRELAAGSPVQETFLVQRVEARKARSSGSPYVALVLRDVAGPLEARIFEAEAAVAEELVPGEPMRFSGTMERYRGGPQLVVERFHKPSTVNESELAAAEVTASPEQLFAEIERILATLTDANLAALRDVYLGDDVFMERLKLVPATVRSHRAWRHGLLEHLAAALTVAESLVGLYPALDRDLVLLGTFLHDSGKAFAFKVDDGEIDYTHAGKLLGHVTLGADYLDRKLQELGEGFPNGLALKLRHILISHPGQTSWGAPRPPMTPEAALIHHVDALDSTIAAMRELEDGTTGYRYCAQLRHDVWIEPRGET